MSKPGPNDWEAAPNRGAGDLRSKLHRDRLFGGGVRTAGAHPPAPPTPEEWAGERAASGAAGPALRGRKSKKGGRTMTTALQPTRRWAGPPHQARPVQVALY